MKNNEKQAVIYCRVSSKKQVEDGHGLSSQETRCREYAKHKGYSVVGVYHDEGVTGKLLDRPRMKEMLSFLNQNKKKQSYVVIIDDISRLARDIETHIHLRAAIQDTAAKLESPSIEFGEGSDSRLVEHLLASVAAHQREKNAEQVRNRMRARRMNGYWMGYPVVGYRFEKIEGHGKMLVRNEPLASIVAEAYEGFASGRFETLTEVKHFLESNPTYPKARNGTVHISRVSELMSRVIYTGHFHMAQESRYFIPGKHEALVSLETWKRVQDRLTQRAKAPSRKDVRDDFPLRGFVTCCGCDQPLTSAWAQGRKEKYPYYFCHRKACPEYSKAIKREKMESDFLKVLEGLRPSHKLFEMATAMLREIWDENTASASTEKGGTQAALQTAERNIQQLLDRILKTDSEALVTAYEKKIQELEETKAMLREKLSKCGTEVPRFEDHFRTALDVLENPCKLWLSDHLEHKRAALKIVFTAKLPYDRKSGFRTASFARPFNVLEDVRRGITGNGAQGRI